jgi:IS5 family transposase
VATTLKRSKGGQFALHATALSGNPYDGHTLEKMIPAMEDTIGAEIERILTDAGYRSIVHGRQHRSLTCRRRRRQPSGCDGESSVRIPRRAK